MASPFGKPCPWDGCMVEREVTPEGGYPEGRPDDPESPTYDPKWEPEYETVPGFITRATGDVEAVEVPVRCENDHPSVARRKGDELTVSPDPDRKALSPLVTDFEAEAAKEARTAAEQRLWVPEKAKSRDH